MWDSFTEQLRIADEQFFVSNDCITKSHQRCEQQGLPRNLCRALDVLDPHEFESTLHLSNGLAAFASLLFIATLEKVTDRRMLLILTDSNARIVALHSAPQVISAAAEKGVCLGASLADESLGTNAVSLALHHLEPVVLRGEQHYCHFMQDWYCVAIPLVDAHGAIIGCVDISMSSEEGLGDRLALAGFLARELVCHFMKSPGRVPNGNREQERLFGAYATIQLTERQKQALALFSKGLSYKQIARQMDLQSIKTVQEHLDAVRVKLGADTRRDCVRIAAENGLLRE